jgi:hypothetical protein
MAKTKKLAPPQDYRLSERVGDATDTLLGAGRSVADLLPGAVGGARGVFGVASAALDDLSDEALIAALGLSAGMTIGLFLAGAPRAVLALALIPTAFTMRAAMQRGVGPRSWWS